MDRRQSGPRSGSRTRRRGDDSEGLFDWNLKSERILFSPRWLALIGCDEHEIGSQPEEWFTRVHPDDRAELLREIEDARAGTSAAFTCRYRLRHNDGTYRWMACRGTVVRDKSGRAIRLTGSQSDITVETVTDRVTGLPNRLLLVDRLAHAIERAQRHADFQCAVLLIEAGRPASVSSPPVTSPRDPLLTAVARRLETCVRDPELIVSVGQNDLVARLDGDYFAVLLNGLKDVADAKVAADRLLGELLKPIPVSGREVRLAASIGIAVSASGYTTAEQMLHDAHVAQHRARVLGGSHCAIFDTAILKSEQAELQLEDEFEAALARGEFVLLFQPIVSLDTSQVVAFEALVRWHHPVVGLIPPVDFIPLAERTGFIVPLGNWILREACQRLQEWAADVPESRDVSVSVNVSSVQADDPAFLDQVDEALRSSGLEPRRLVLELTEGLAMANPMATTTLLMRLRAIGVRISVDDFGTGYSSLAYLRQFPVDTLKIDRSFVRGMAVNQNTAEIVAGVINMAQQLGLNVVAEGIEHEDQRRRLRALLCHAGQGTLFSAPLSAEAAVELLRHGLPTPAPEQPARSVAQSRRLSQLLVAAGHRVTSPRTAFAAAAFALVLVAGFVTIIGKARAARGSSVSANEEIRRTPAALPAAGTDAVLPAEPAADVAPASIASADVGKDVPGPTTASSPAPLPGNSTRVTSMKVVHLHRLGSCRGRLSVSRDGVAFVSDSDGEDDAFTLKYAEFLDAVADDTLILRSATRTYRFKAAAAPGKNGPRLRDVADTIARSRR